MEIRTFGVIGAGQMGNGIAQVAAMSGLEVIMKLGMNHPMGPLGPGRPDWIGHQSGNYGNVI